MNCPVCKCSGGNHLDLCSRRPMVDHERHLISISAPRAATLNNLMEQLMEEATDAELCDSFEQRLAGLIQAHAIERKLALPRTKKGRSFAERFWARVGKTEDCWLWAGPKQIWVPEQNTLAIPQRVAWWFRTGEWLATQQFVRTCQEKYCVRFEHLVVKPDIGAPKTDEPHVFTNLEGSTAPTESVPKLSLRQKIQQLDSELEQLERRTPVNTRRNAGR